MRVRNTCAFLVAVAVAADHGVKLYTNTAELMGSKSAPSSVAACNTTAELDAWRAKQEAPIKKYVPKEWQASAMTSIEKEYKSNLHRIEVAQSKTKKKQPAMFLSTGDADRPDMETYTQFAKLVGEKRAPSSAASCNTAAELDAWRAKQEAPIKKYVPMEWQASAMTSIEKEYKENLHRIEAAQSKTATKQPAMLLTTGDSEHQDMETYTQSPKNSASSAAACSTTAELDAWRAKQEAPIKKYVPKEWQVSAMTSIEQKYKENLRRIEAAQSKTAAKQPAMLLSTQFANFVGEKSAPSSVAACNTTAELDAWRAKQEAPIKKYVPKEWQASAMTSIEKEYKENLRRIEAAQSKTAAKQPKFLASIWNGRDKTAQHGQLPVIVSGIAFLAVASVVVSALRRKRRVPELQDTLLAHQAPLAA